MEIKRFDRTRNQRQRKRAAQLNAIAQELGFATWRKLETAVLNAKARTLILDFKRMGDEQ